MHACMATSETSQSGSSDRGRQHSVHNTSDSVLPILTCRNTIVVVKFIILGSEQVVQVRVSIFCARSAFLLNADSAEVTFRNIQLFAGVGLRQILSQILVLLHSYYRSFVHKWRT